MYPKKLTRQVICNADEPVVQTSAGRLRGLLTEGTYIFRGIKYADARRFHMPEPVKSWEGVKNAIHFGNTCPEMSTGIPSDEEYVPHFYYPQDENCQYLNVWTQSLSREAKRPVLFWIHGGGYVAGSSNEIFSYDGENLSAYGDAVVVSINHRLNVLGFLDLSAYGEEYRYSGNLSIADIVAALRWVRENIAAFGGDPDNVTIMGQSGGGFKVAAILQTPSADGLYHRAVIQSGMMEGRGNHLQSHARQVSARVLEILNIAPENVSRIETVPYYILRRAAVQAANELRQQGIAGAWSPVYDGDFYLGNALSECGFRPETLHVPVLIGSNLGEFTGNASYSPRDIAKNEWEESYVAELMQKRYGENADKVAAAFAAAYPRNPAVDALFVDTAFRRGVIAYARDRAAAGGTVYSYMFKPEFPYLGGSLAWHNAEEAFMFHNAEHVWSSYIPGQSERLQDRMATAWLRFAASGDPNHPDLPAWPRVSADREPTMIFDWACSVVYNHDHELMACIRNPQPLGRAKTVFAPMPNLGGGPRQSL